jgi:hypothetical protein
MQSPEQRSTVPDSEREISVKFSEVSKQIANGRADPRLLDDYLMYGGLLFQDILSQTRSLEKVEQWKIRLRFEELMTGYTFNHLIETHLEKMTRARNGSFHNEKASYCFNKAENYRELAGVYAKDRRKAKEMGKLANGWSKMGNACLAMPK